MQWTFGALVNVIISKKDFSDENKKSWQDYLMENMMHGGNTNPNPNPNPNPNLNPNPNITLTLTLNPKGRDGNITGHAHSHLGKFFNEMFNSLCEDEQTMSPDDPRFSFRVRVRVRIRELNYL
jgi:hypothetical protein